jgi:hypothetical protein
MKSSIRGAILGTIGVALLGLAGCSEDNMKNAGDDYKNTTTGSPDAKVPTKADLAKRYATQGGGSYRSASKGMSPPAAKEKK